MRFILALIPPKQSLVAYLQAAQLLFSPVKEGYLLSENSLPHITVCQFECDDEQKVQAVWHDIQKLNIQPFSPRFTGVSFQKEKREDKVFYWAELSVARDPEIMRVHRSAAELIRSKGLICLNDSGDLYRPHLTLARIRLPDVIQKWPEGLLAGGQEFKLALARGDDFGQYLYTLFE